MMSLRIILALLLMGTLGVAQAHFQMIIPSDDMVSQNESKNLKLDIQFWHPFEGKGMPMDMPVQFGVMVKGKKQDLRDSLKPFQRTDREGTAHASYKALYSMKSPGDHIFYIEPSPYWEPAEESFIVHYTKVIVNGFGLEEGWDEEVGLKTEITPLTRPYGLWAGNLFSGIVKVKGKPMPYAEVEVEYYDQESKRSAPADPMITQVIKADANGVFYYAMPWSGWWGFAALTTDEKKLKHDGKDYPVENGAVLWINTHKAR